MSTVYTPQPVGLGLNFSGQGDEQGYEIDMNSYPQEANYTSYPQDYNSSPALSASPHGIFIQRNARSEGEPTPSPHLSESNYLSPRGNHGYGQTRYAARFHSARNSPSMMLSPAAYSPYPQSPFCPSPATFSDTPLASPLQSEFHDPDAFTYFGTPQMISQHQSDGLHSGYASPAMLHHSPDQVSAEYYGHTALVSPPITPMEAQTPYVSSVKIAVDDRSYEYPMSPYTPTHPSYLLPHPQTYDDSSRRPVSAGRLMPQQELYHQGGMNGLKRAASLNSSRYAKSLSPPRSSPSPPGNKRPTYSKWTTEEDEMLRHAISIHGTSKWSLVAAMVKGRTAMQCSTRWQGALNTTIHKGKWELEEDRILIAAVEKWKAEHPPRSPSFEDSDDEDDQAEAIPWGLIATMLPRRRTGIQCQARWSEALDPTVRKGKWTAEEDEMLYKGVAEHGQCWIKVASTVQGRTQRQIRTRWMQIRGRDKDRV